MAFADLADHGQRLLKSTHGNGDVFAHLSTTLSAYRERNATPPAPELINGLPFVDEPDKAGLLRQCFAQPVTEALRFRSRPVRFRDQEHPNLGLDAARKASSAGSQRTAVKVLQGSRNQAIPVDASNGSNPAGDVPIARHDRDDLFGRWGQPQPRAGDDAERSLGADK